MKLYKIQTVPGFAQSAIFPDSFFDIQLNLINEYRFEPLTKEAKTRQPSSSDTAKIRQWTEICQYK